MGLTIAFWVFAVVSVLSALGVIFLRNVFRAALLLMLCFFSVAGIFVTLGADFLAAVQVLIYVGAVGALVLMAILLTREIHRGSPFSKWGIPAAILAAALLGVLIWAALGTSWPSPQLPPPQPTTAQLAERIFNLDTGFVLPFEIASLLLLAAIIGAIALVREK